MTIRYISEAAKNHHATNHSVRREFNVYDLFQRINIGKEFYLKQLSNVFDTIQFDKLKTDEATLLLKCCGSLIPDSTREQRNSLCQNLFEGLQKTKYINAEIVDRYIKTCTENGIAINFKELLNSHGDKVTYTLLLENVCQSGSIEAAFEILEIMKNKGIPLDTKSASDLILAHTIYGGLQSGEEVIKTIRTAQISTDHNISLAVLKGLIKRGNLKEFEKAVEKYPISLNEYELLHLIEELGLKGLESWLPKIESFYKNIPITRDLQIQIEKICIHLVHMEQPEYAIKIYEKFIEPPLDGSFGFSILKEMLHCNIDINLIIVIAKSLKDKELNPYILEAITELALRYKYSEKAWVLLKSLYSVRPHYFWPLLIQSGKTMGEPGVVLTLRQIKEFNIKLDAESLEQYVLPYFNLSNLKLVVLKFQDIGYNVKEILNPLLNVLLMKRMTKQASELCRLFNVNISGERFFKLLSKSWLDTTDSTSITVLLTRYCESNTSEQDLVGAFLIDIAKCRNKEDMETFVDLLKAIHKTRLRISAQSADILQETCQLSTEANSKNVLYSLIDFGLRLAEENAIPHPRSMDLDGLECHLIELQEKNMDTRGVLRKLLQMHANAGNNKRVKELREIFLNSGYEESSGIKSSVMHSFVLGGHLDEAFKLYKEINDSSPDFTLDSFKFIDLTRLLIENDRFDEGYNVLCKEALKCKNVRNIRAIERNCRELLSSCQNPEQLSKIFKLLTEAGLCVASNVMLGPLVKIHLKSGNIDQAVETYIELSKKHRVTPLQFEVLSALAKSENSIQLQRVLEATEAVHGYGPAQMGLIAALAENGQEHALKKLLMSITFPIQGLLHSRCKRWVMERKLEPLKCLVRASNRLNNRVLKIDSLLKHILDIYDLNDDCDGAIKFVDDVSDDLKSLELEQELQKLKDKHNNSRFIKKVANKW